VKGLCNRQCNRIPPLGKAVNVQQREALPLDYRKTSIRVNAYDHFWRVERNSRDSTVA
jgi:hypothetical protein